MHYLGVCCILLIEEYTTLILVLYIIYTGQPSFCLVHFYDLHILLSQFYLVHNVNTPLQCLLILFHFILPTCQNFTMHFMITCYVLFQDHFA